MKILDTLEMKGRLTIYRREPGGGTVVAVAADNAIVLSGRELVAQLFISEPVHPISHIAVGSDGTAVNPDADTRLKQELFRAPIASVQSPPEVKIVDAEGRKARVTISVALDYDHANGELREAGLFNSDDPEHSVMYNRVVFPVITKTSDFQLTLVWDITF